jgi:Fe-Mn family superoxide dismutase
MMTRRQVIQAAALTAAATAASPNAAFQAQQPSGTPADAGPFKLPPLPYAYEALEPFIDAQTMMLHHDKHHAAYVQNLNKALSGEKSLEGKTIEEVLSNLAAVPESIRTAVRNHGGGHYNHTLYWQMMKKGGGPPKGELAKALDKSFGNYATFQEKFNAAATKHFGSGWAWLTLNPKKELVIETTPNQDCPLTAGNQPLLLIDVWEHAYYLKYQNRRAEYIAAFNNIINWDFVGDRYAKLAG